MSGGSLKLQNRSVAVLSPLDVYSLLCLLTLTGGSRGIGLVTAKLLALRGAKVMISARKEEELKDGVKEIEAAGGEAAFHAADVSSEAEVKALVAATVQKFGRLDIAFNNAGAANDDSDKIHEMDVESFAQLQKNNVLSVLLCMKYETQQFLAQRDKDKAPDLDKLDESAQPNDHYRSSHPYAIVNTSSVAGLKGSATSAAYCTSKFAVQGLTQVAALEYGPLGVRVNAINPGYTYTEMTKSVDHAKKAKGIPLRRIGQAQEIAEVAAFLLSNAASYMTGQSVVADGGMLLS